MTDIPTPASDKSLIIQKPPSLRSKSRADLEAMVYALRKEAEDMEQQLQAHKVGMNKGNQYATQLATVVHNALLFAWPWEHPILEQYAAHFELTAENVEERKAALVAELEKS